MSEGLLELTELCDGLVSKTEKPKKELGDTVRSGERPAAHGAKTE